MKLVIYLLKKIIPMFFGAALFFALVLNLVDLFMNITNYLQNDADVKSVLLVMLYYIPKTLWYGIPVAILFATSYVLSGMYATNELEALFASGVSLYKFTFPLLLLSVFMSFGLYFFENSCVVQTYEKKISLQNNLLNKSENENNTNVIVISQGGRLIYKAHSYTEASKRLQNLYLIFRNENKEAQCIVYAKNAIWNEEKAFWDLQSPIEYKFLDKGLQIVDYETSLNEYLTENYEIFRKNIVNVQSVTSREAKIYINHLRRAGLPYQEQLSEYYKKFAFPFIILIVVFLSVGLTGRTKKNVLLISLASSISASVLFYVTMMVTMVLAKHGYITPFMGAFAPVIIFTMVSLVLLRYIRT